ncbi:hypothetical protein OG410_22355 [Streptomyces sp. NBC_00659]|uniref:hypothetical protein n=1 Tax=Streptomyces sp. NBC_00659 TaxID=2903669 RepID=UPI002E30425F|nr:hypothetical protein [Streptomyces sp. NBC_00659]
MSSQSQPNDQTAALLAAAKQATKTALSVIAAEMPKIKAEWTKDIQTTLLKTDVQAATLSSQLFKFDQSLFKWDEKGLTFAGRPIGPGKKWSLENAVYGRGDQREKDEKKKKEAAEEKAAATARQQERERAKKFEEDLKRQVTAARSDAGHAKNDAIEAHKNSELAKNLLTSAKQHARLAGESATRANKALTALEKRVDELAAHI